MTDYQRWASLSQQEDALFKEQEMREEQQGRETLFQNTFQAHRQSMLDEYLSLRHLCDQRMSQVRMLTCSICLFLLRFVLYV